MDWTLEVVIVPVSDVDRSLAFYRDQMGFKLDHDTTLGDDDRFVQLTPPGSGCSIVFGTMRAIQRMTPGSLQGLQLVVSDGDEARRQLTERGVDAGETVVLADRDGGRMFTLSDPDGNGWVVQEIRARAEKPLIPSER